MLARWLGLGWLADKRRGCVRAKRKFGWRECRVGRVKESLGTRAGVGGDATGETLLALSCLPRDLLHAPCPRWPRDDACACVYTCRERECVEWAGCGKQGSGKTSEGTWAGRLLWLLLLVGESMGM